MKKKRSRVVPTPSPSKEPEVPPGESLYHPKHWKKQTNDTPKEKKQ